MTRRQHHKGRKRPRAWHRGAGVGRAWIIPGRLGDGDKEVKS